MEINARTLLPVVVTRPAPDHVELLSALQRQGRPAVYSPAFRLIEQQPALTAPELDTLMGQASALIAVSPMAARRSLQVFDTQQLSRCRIFTPGVASASAFIEQGLDVLTPEALGTSEAILALPELRDVDGQIIVIAAAPGGRTLLAETLEKRGAIVMRIELYRREPLKPSAGFLRFLADRSRSREDFYSMITSSIAFDAIRTDLSQTQAQVWLQGRFIVSSDRLKAIVQAAGAERVTVAASAADTDMLRALSD